MTQASDVSDRISGIEGATGETYDLGNGWLAVVIDRPLSLGGRRLDAALWLKRSLVVVVDRGDSDENETRAHQALNSNRRVEFIDCFEPGMETDPIARAIWIARREAVAVHIGAEITLLEIPANSELEKRQRLTSAGEKVLASILAPGTTRADLEKHVHEMHSILYTATECRALEEIIERVEKVRDTMDREYTLADEGAWRCGAGTYDDTAEGEEVYSERRGEPLLYGRDFDPETVESIDLGEGRSAVITENLLLDGSIDGGLRTVSVVGRSSPEATREAALRWLDVFRERHALMAEARVAAKPELAKAS